MIKSHILSQFESHIGHCITQKPIVLRCPKYSGEDRVYVEACKQELQNMTGVESLIISDQTHSDVCIEININNRDENIHGDAMYTCEKNIALFVLASDCVPILFYDSSLKIIGVIHAGRRGLELGIIHKIFSSIIEKYNSNIADLQIFIAPHICSSCYELGEQEISKFREKYDTCIYENTDKKGKYFLDIGSIAYKQLLGIGIKKSQIEHSKVCTYEKELLHSYRRKTHTNYEMYGNNGFGIWLK